MNTPIAYSGIRLLMLALNATSSAVAAAARVRMPLENTSRWPRRVDVRGMDGSPGGERRQPGEVGERGVGRQDQDQQGGDLDELERGMAERGGLGVQDVGG